MNDNKKGNHQWILFIAVVLILLGVYGSLRTFINIFAFEKYPQGGVYPDNLPFFNNNEDYGYGYAYTNERDCDYNYTYYVEETDKVREPTPEEKASDEKDKLDCLEGVKESREAAKINDISQSILLLFLGAGVLAFRKIFDK